MEALNARGLISIILAVFSALSVRILLLDFIPQMGNFAAGLSRLPLYIIALAFGPSAGLVAGILFLSFANLLQLPDIILLLELSVLGWFAISPSPRQYWGAGLFSAIFAYCLTWAAAGSFYLQWQFGTGANLLEHLTYHASAIPGLLGMATVIALIPPSFYQKLFPYSAIIPDVMPKADETSAPHVLTPVETVSTYSSKPKVRSLLSPDRLNLFSFERNKEKSKLSELVSPDQITKAKPGNRTLEHIEVPNLANSKN